MTNITKEKAENMAYIIAKEILHLSLLNKDSYLLPNLNWVRKDNNINQRVELLINKKLECKNVKNPSKFGSKCNYN